MKRHNFKWMLVITLLSMSYIAYGATTLDKEQALNSLKDGNKRFVSGLQRSQTYRYPNLNQGRLNTVSKGQNPFATIIGCSDSRVPLEHVFNVGLGDIFPIRVAGNVCDVDEIGSIEYGVGHLSTPVMVIVGHTSCGAVTAVAEDAEVHGSIPELVDNIVPAVMRVKRANPGARGSQLVSMSVRENVWQSIDDLFAGSSEVRHLVESGALTVQGAIYSLETGKVEWLGEHPEQNILLKYTGGNGEHAGGADHAAGTNSSESHQTSTKQVGETEDHKTSSFGEVFLLVLGIAVLLGILVFVLTKTQYRLEDLRIRTKIFTLSASVITVFVIVLIFTETKLSAIGRGFEEVEAVYIPLILNVSEIEVQLLEQEMALQGLFSAKNKRKFDEMITHEHEFDAFGEGIHAEIVKSEELLETNEDMASSEADLEFFKQSLRHLKTIESEANDFKENGDKIISLLQSGKFREADALEYSVEEEGKRLIAELDEFHTAIEVRTDSLAHVIENQEKATVQAIIIMIIIGIGVGVFLTIYIANNMATPINTIKEVALGELDLTKRLDISSKDEIGDLATGFNRFLERLQENAENQAGARQGIQVGTDQLASIDAELASVSEELNQRSGNIADQSNMVAAAAEQMSTNMDTIAQASQTSQDNMNSVGSATEEMTSTVAEIAQNAEQAREITEEAVKNVASASKRVNKLGTAANDISNVTETIIEIAEQTKLLALNATIEAARAGEAGKGFAVVANEVKELAKQTNDATADISHKIEAIQTETSGTVTEISSITDVIDRVNAIVNTIATAVEEQNVTTQDIAGNIGLATNGMNDIVNNVNQAATVSRDVATNIAAVNTDIGNVKQTGEDLTRTTLKITETGEQLKEMAGTLG